MSSLTRRDTVTVEARTPDGGPGGDVRIEDVGMCFTSASGAQTQAIECVSGVVEEGRFVSVIGPSGCGKSTLFDIVGGLTQPTSGRVLIAGTEVRGPRRDTTMVFQGDSTLHWRTVAENVAFGLEVAGVGREQRLSAARDMIRLVGLAGFEDHQPRQLSGGMRQRVAIARALVMNPRILLMDEPFGALDQQTRILLGQELTRIWEESRPSVLFVTHDIQEAVLLSDEVWVMSRRPSRLKAVLPIELERPRKPNVVNSTEFHRHAAALWEMLSDEARAAMETTKA
jgi:NitT/TauT family transport system ATP-binding protein